MLIIIILLFVGLFLYLYFRKSENIENIHTKQYNEAKEYLSHDYKLKLKDLDDMYKKNIIEFNNNK